MRLNISCTSTKRFIILIKPCAISSLQYPLSDCNGYKKTSLTGLVPARRPEVISAMLYRTGLSSRFTESIAMQKCKINVNLDISKNISLQECCSK